MKKMSCLFVREFHGKQSPTLTDHITPGCEWVVQGLGTASIKRDGTACLFKNNQLFKRYDAKKDRATGEYKTAPAGAVPCDEPDPVTGHWPHWVLIGEHDYWHHEAFKRQCNTLVEGTYELCGPKISANPERLEKHELILHGFEVVDFKPFINAFNEGPFHGFWAMLSQMDHEGVVFKSPEGLMCKLRRKDYGLSWPIQYKKGFGTQEQRL